MPIGGGAPGLPSTIPGRDTVVAAAGLAELFDMKADVPARKGRRAVEGLAR